MFCKPAKRLATGGSESYATAAITIPAIHRAQRR